MGTYKKEISGWGGLAKGESNLARPERIDDIKEKGHVYSARGLGRSYGDASLNTGNETILMERLNRFLEFDKSSGVLKAESGVSIKDIVKTFVPKGFFVPVTPGTKEATLGGCLAADVHGKNHHKDGSFSEHVVEFEILTPNGLKKRVQRKDEELFNATAGGMGLTGIITEITLKLLPIETPFIKTMHTPCTSLEDLLAHLSENGKNERYSVAWVDLLSTKRGVRSIAMSGDHLLKEELINFSKIKADFEPGEFQVPFHFPSFTLNAMGQKLFNALYFHVQKRKKTFLSSLESFFYPLDKLKNWNRLYGKRGFYQYQFVVPEKGSEIAIKKVLETLQKRKCPVFLAVLKKFGKENNGYLSFPKDGFTLTMDIPGNYPGLFALLDNLDEIIMEHEGRVYLAKDFHLGPAAFRSMYPRYEIFNKLKKKIDPEFLIQTDLSRRLKIGYP